MPTEVEVQRRLLDAVQELISAAAATRDRQLLTELTCLKDAVFDPKLQIGVFGDVGNGKSALINSLIGSLLLPMGAVAATRVAARVDNGASPDAYLWYKDGARLRVIPDDLGRLSPDQVARIDRIDFTAPAEILARARFLDTPDLTDSRCVDQWLPQSDCVLFVLNCDRLLSMTELKFITEVLGASGIDQVCFILNRCDGKSPAEIEALTERARHLLEPRIPSAMVAPYAALPALQSILNGDNSGLDAVDPQGLVEMVQTRWIARAAEQKVASVRGKLDRIRCRLDDSVVAATERSSEDLRALDASLGEAETELDELRQKTDGACRRVASGLESVREQLLVGLKDFSLKLREGIPVELRRVPIGEARRFLPFYIQHALKRAVDENHEAVRSAIESLASSLPLESSETVRSLVTAFQVDVEPPAIPLYVGRDRTPLSQGSLFVLVAAIPITISNLYLASALIATSLLSREIGKQLEASDRRANLASAAQSLLHGFIDSMERSIRDQFQEIEAAIVDAVRLSFGEQLSAVESALGAAAEARETALVEHQAMTARLETATGALDRARLLLQQNMED